VDRVVSVDLHCGQIQGFFQKVPVDNLFSTVAIAPYLAQKGLKNLVVVSPDAGGVARAKEFMEHLTKLGGTHTISMMCMSTRRPKTHLHD
jgi:ribose-phosphate pyrophosphokinase